MRISKFVDGNVYTLGIEGRVDMLNSAEFQREVDDAVAKLAGKSGVLTLDLIELKYISSAGLRVIISAKKQMTKGGGVFKIINVIPAIMEIFTITGFADVLDITEAEVNKQ